MKHHSRSIVVIGLVLLCHEISLCKGGLLVPAIFNFGDSTTDTGTNNFLPNPGFLANFVPYGQTFFNNPTGRFSDGRLTVDLIAQALSVPLLKPFLEPGVNYYDEGISFASAGSGFLQSTKTGRVVSIPTQLQQFKQVKASLRGSRGWLSAQALLFRSIFLVSSGANDIYYSFFPNETTPQAFADRLILELENTLTVLLGEGANKLVVAGIGPIGCVPNQVFANGTCDETKNLVARLYNQQLSSVQLRLSLKFPLSFITLAKTYDTLDGFIRHGQLFGFTKGSNACCGGGPFRGASGNQCGTKDSAGNNLYTQCADSELGEYVFWDNFHPTEKAYTLLSLLFLTGDLTAISPFNINTLASK